MNQRTFVLLTAIILAVLLFLYTCIPGESSLDGNASANPGSPESSAPTASTPAATEPAASATPSATPTAPATPKETPGAVPAKQQTATPAADPEPRTYATASLPPVRVLPPSPAPPLQVPVAIDNTRVESQLVAMGELVQLRSRYRLDIPGSLTMAKRYRGFPGSTINTPTGFGPGWGQFYGGVSFQERIRYADARDGVLTFGFGLGNPRRTVGMDVSVNVLDTYHEFAKDRSLSLRLHRRLPARTSLAVGWENIWHTSGTDGGSSRYVVASKVLGLRENFEQPLGSVVFSLGLGDERFLSEPAFARQEGGVNPFGAVAVRVLPHASAIANWTGQDLSLGVSIAPVRRWPLVITPAVMDLTGNAGDGARFSVSAGLGYNFRY